MGFSVSGSFAILVLASFIAFGMLYSAGANGVERVSEATTETYDDDLHRQNTAIEISEIEFQGSQLDVNVTNNGTTALALNDTDLIVDNSYQRQEDLQRFRVVGQPDSELWLPGETLFFRVDLPGGDPQRVTVATKYGVAVSGVVP